MMKGSPLHIFSKRLPVGKNPIGGFEDVIEWRCDGARTLAVPHPVPASRLI
jgi:hypothetical protein